MRTDENCKQRLSLPAHHVVRLPSTWQRPADLPGADLACIVSELYLRLSQLPHEAEVAPPPLLSLPLPPLPPPAAAAASGCPPLQGAQTQVPQSRRHT